jgi:hypothetical protein
MASSDAPVWKWRWHRWIGAMFGPIPIGLIIAVAFVAFVYLK